MSRPAWRQLLSRRTAFIFLAALTAVSTALPASAATNTAQDFSLDVSPSTLVATVKPGMSTEMELKIRNAGTKAEQLKIETRDIKVGSTVKDVTLSDTTPPDLAKWVRYDNPTFTIEPGAWFTQRITVNLPEQAGFSYPFAVVISRVNEKAATERGRLIKGSVGVFALVNVDKPGATRVLGISELKMSQSVYEFLPASINLTMKNTGNSIVQPYGNIYLQRNGSDATPISVLPLNNERGYILPNTTRAFGAEWTDGFPHYKTVTKDGKQTKELVWEWDMVSHLRIGRYTAKVVAVYNDGHRDVPIIGEVGFWVIPWRLLATFFVVLALIIFGIWSVVRTTIRTARRIVPHKKPPTD